MKKKEIKRPKNFLGSTRKRNGQKLFSMNPENGHVYEVEIEKQVPTVNLDKDQRFKRADFKAKMDPKHMSLWAVNKKNAKRKFAKLVNLQIAREVIAEQKAKLSAKKEVVLEGQDDYGLINKETKK